MPIRYADTPQLYNSAPSAVDKTISRIPQGARPMSEAPQNVAIAVQGQNGQVSWAISHRDRFEKLLPERDRISGAVTWRMCGESISHPLAWWHPQQRR
jgi:hypothetical protein